jgi:hypothetical protein
MIDLLLLVLLLLFNFDANGIFVLSNNFYILSSLFNFNFYVNVNGFILDKYSINLNVYFVFYL